MAQTTKRLFTPGWIPNGATYGSYSGSFKPAKPKYESGGDNCLVCGATATRNLIVRGSRVLSPRCTKHKDERVTPNTGGW